MMNFFRSSEGGFMDVIRCDEQEYLVHKWSPNGVTNTTAKENAIRYGSSVRVKEGEVAVFVYPQQDGSMHDFIAGPIDKTIKTENFPILASIVGAAFGGNSPFQAEIYFINLSGNIQLRFGIPYFDVFDPRFIDLGVPTAVRGSLTFNITDYKNFIKLNRLVNFNLDNLKEQIEDFFVRKAKSVVLNIPSDAGIPVVQLERNIDEINNILQEKLTTALREDFGINLKRVDISAIETNKNHPNYIQLKKATADQQTKFIDAKTGIEITNLSETARIDRKDKEMGVERDNFAVHQLNQQADVLKTAASNLGGSTLGGNGGFNAGGIMAGMAVGGAMGSQFTSMAGSMNNTPPPRPLTAYHIALNGQQSGPFSINQLQQYAENGQFSKEYHIWKPGMAGWELAGNFPEVSSIFDAIPPPPPLPTDTSTPEPPKSSINLDKKK